MHGSIGWTNMEELYLMLLWPSVATDEQLQAFFKRSRTTILRKAARLGLRDRYAARRTEADRIMELLR